MQYFGQILFISAVHLRHALQESEGSMTLEEQTEALKEIEKTHELALKLCRDLLDPEVYGFSVNPDIHNRAREVFGIKQVK